VGLPSDRHNRSRITELTPTRGFAAEFSAATVVVVASRMGLPISATHTLVGAVMGVGLARGLREREAGRDAGDCHIVDCDHPD